MIRFLRYLGFFLLVGLVVWAGPKRMWMTLSQAQLGWLALAWILNIPQLGLKALRWFRIVRWQAIPMTYGRALLAYFGSLLVGFLTPGRVGEAAKALTLKHEAGVPLAKGLSSVVLDRAFDLYLLVALGAVGLVRFALLGHEISIVDGCLYGALLLLPLGLLHPRIARRVGRFLATMPILKHRPDNIVARVDRFAEGLEVLTPTRVLICVILTAAAYLIFFYQCSLCTRALGFQVPFGDLVLLMAATNLLSFIPISISGLGTREACLIYFMSRLVVPLPTAMAVSFGLTVFLVFFVGGGLMGFVCWQWAPIGLQRARRELTMKKTRPIDHTDDEV